MMIRNTRNLNLKFIISTILLPQFFYLGYISKFYSLMIMSVMLLIGNICNLIVVKANNNLMPVLVMKKDLKRFYIGKSPIHKVMNKNDKFKFLGDIFRIQWKKDKIIMYSIGDLINYTAIITLIIFIIIQFIELFILL